MVLARSGLGRTLVGGLAVLLIALSGCSAKTKRLNDAEMSGFLEGYAALEPVDRGFLYTNDAAHWSSYDKIHLTPVTIWRAGENSLDEVDEVELAKAATLLDRALRERLAKDYTIVDKPAPGTIRLSLAITEALHEHEKISIVTADVSGQPIPVDAEISDELEAFADVAMIEVEARDATTRQLLAAAVDTYIAPEGQEKGSGDSWEDVARAFAWWADRLADWLTNARKGDVV